ncbi:peptidoglycan D,D-transpeptidase FtsI family protein [Idiomarina seosinensis]|uniref:Peptidoglycan D,D-transpeptidase FtsI n=1 Tax=Idiomarina seosinensis TaxID=281739 RepID=A0A432ZDC7_9GAMM|nr:penicillin-binding transpeptidase domain-containing protein [Idiomarina seosinensis]RUO75890.1 peptidoglycan glycosyltransferase FtsI [Idiomarina seosinensis]
MAVKPQRKQNVKRNRRNAPAVGTQWRFYLAVTLLFTVFSVLIARAAYIQVISPDIYSAQGDMRSLRSSSLSVQRGMIVDRNGRELALSVPVETVWADPQRIAENNALSDSRRWQALAETFRMNRDELVAKVSNPERRFVYLQRKVTPSEADYVRQLKIPGVYLKTESRRYYPTGEISAHLLGITNIDGQGQEGIELLYDEHLTGTPGQRVYRKDAQGRVIEEISQTDAQQPKKLTLSIDQRIQATAYTELKKAVRYNQATSGSAVVIDVDTGEVLAMVNSPSFNPNNRADLQSFRMRNRAITDSYEPGSTVKPLVVLSALENGLHKTGDTIDTSPGWMRLGGRRVSDPRDYGELTLGGVLEKSSNVGVTTIALELGVDELLQSYFDVGFGSDTGVSLLGEAVGLFGDRRRWSDFELATLSYGYGLSVTTLQLARAYTAIASGGMLRPLTIFRQESPLPAEQVFSPDNTRAVMRMMERVVESGTAKEAQVPGYRVAGKTGTTRKASATGGYGDEYVALFAGMAPASNPEVVVVVTINEPGTDDYYGGTAAAPVFSSIVGQTMRLLNIPPDNLANEPMKAAGVGGH